MYHIEMQDSEHDKPMLFIKVDGTLRGAFELLASTSNGGINMSSHKKPYCYFKR